MKRDFLKIMMIALLPLCAVSCIDNVPEEEVLPRDAVSFDYYIDQEKEPKYYLDYYVDLLLGHSSHWYILILLMCVRCVAQW